ESPLTAQTPASPRSGPGDSSIESASNSSKLVSSSAGSTSSMSTSVLSPLPTPQLSEKRRLPQTLVATPAFAADSAGTAAFLQQLKTKQRKTSSTSVTRQKRRSTPTSSEEEFLKGSPPDSERPQPEPFRPAEQKLVNLNRPLPTPP